MATKRNFNIKLTQIPRVKNDMIIHYRLASAPAFIHNHKEFYFLPVAMEIKQKKPNIWKLKRIFFS